MAKRNQKRWIYSPTKPAKPKVPETQKQLINQECNQFIERELKPQFITSPSEKSWHNIVDIFGKWYRNFYYFCCTYKLTDPDRSLESFEEKFARLEYFSPDKFNLAYMRHTGKWWEIPEQYTLEKALAEIKKNQIFHPY